jgi:hypothetical protein
MATDRIITELEGVVTQVNGNGFKLEGRAEWLKLSRFAEPAPTLPDKHDRVRVSLDKGGYVRAIAVLNAPQTHQNGRELASPAVVVSPLVTPRRRRTVRRGSWGRRC